MEQTINEWGPHVLMQVFQKINNAQQILGVFSYVNKTWLEASVFYFNTISNPLCDEDGTIDFSSVVNLHGNTVNFFLKHLRHNISSKKLKITATFELTGKRLMMVAKKNPQLTHLYLYGCRHLSFTGVLEACKMLPNLKYLDVRECPEIVNNYDIVSLTKLVPQVDYLPTTLLPGLTFEDQVLQPRPGEGQHFIQQCEILGIRDTTNITFKRVNFAYKELSLLTHPDKFSTVHEKRLAHHNFIRIKNAHTYLCSLAEA